MSSDHFAHFLRAAKSATYAAQGDGTSVVPVLQDSNQLEYRQGNYFYCDIYVGVFRSIRIAGLRPMAGFATGSSRRGLESATRSRLLGLSGGLQLARHEMSDEFYQNKT